jgi:hypothetical protein
MTDDDIYRPFLLAIHACASAIERNRRTGLPCTDPSAAYMSF